MYKGVEHTTPNRTKQVEMIVETIAGNLLLGLKTHLYLS